MYTMQVAQKLVELCRQGKYLEAIDALYSPNIVSIEPMSMPDMPARMEGIDAVRRKNVWFLENHEMHSHDLMGPFVNGDRFLVHAKMEVTAKTGPMAGKRMKMEEGALYTVKDGKVVKDEFFAVPRDLT